MKNIKTIIKKQIERIASTTIDPESPHGYFHKVTVPDILKESTDNAGADKE